MKSKAIGFTLIELIVVVTIVALLASVALPVYKSYTVRANINISLQSVKTYADNIRRYYELHLQKIGSGYLHAISGPVGIVADESFHWVFLPPYPNNGSALANKLKIGRMYYEGHPEAANPYFYLVIYPINTGDAVVDAGNKNYVYGCVLKKGLWKCTCSNRWNINHTADAIDMNYLPNSCREYSSPINTSGFL